MDKDAQVEPSPLPPEISSDDPRGPHSWKARGGMMIVTDEGEFRSPIVQESLRTYYSRISSFFLGRQKVFNLREIDDKFCVVSDVVKAGYLEKRGSFFKSFKRRYFVLRADKALLTYYESEKSMHRTLGAIYLSENTIIETINNNNSKRDYYEFIVRTPKFKRLETEQGARRLRRSLLKSLYALRPWRNVRCG